MPIAPKNWKNMWRTSAECHSTICAEHYWDAARLVKVRRKKRLPGRKNKEEEKEEEKRRKEEKRKRGRSSIGQGEKGQGEKGRGKGDIPYSFSRLSGAAEPCRAGTLAGS